MRIAAAALPRAALARNEVWALRCLSSQAGPHWLEGHPWDGTAGLGRERDLAEVGTAWEVYREEPDVVLLRCLGEEGGSHSLDGRTLDSTVGLAPVTTGIYTGTRSRLHGAAPGRSHCAAWASVRDRVGCVGTPATGHLELVYNLDGYDATTMWQVVRVASPPEPPPPAPRAGHVVIVEGARAWTPTGVALSSGQVVRVIASGGVSFRPGPRHSRRPAIPDHATPRQTARTDGACIRAVPTTCRATRCLGVSGEVVLSSSRSERLGRSASAATANSTWASTTTTLPTTAEAWAVRIDVTQAH